FSLSEISTHDALLLEIGLTGLIGPIFGFTMTLMLSWLPRDPQTELYRQAGSRFRAHAATPPYRPFLSMPFPGGSDNSPTANRSTSARLIRLSSRLFGVARLPRYEGSSCSKPNRAYR